jgi:hypothetical protein
MLKKVKSKKWCRLPVHIANNKISTSKSQLIIILIKILLQQKIGILSQKIMPQYKKSQSHPLKPFSKMKIFCLKTKINLTKN